MAEQRRLDNVAAHTMLNSVAAVTGLLRTTLTRDLRDEDREERVRIALRRLEQIADQLRDIARGIPDEVIELRDEMSQER